MVIRLARKLPWYATCVTPIVKKNPAALFAFVLGAGLCSCGPSEPAGRGEGESKDASKTFWELRDDSMLSAKIDPAPPREGAAQLKIEITTDDNEQKFAGTLDYRMVPSGQTSMAWQPISKGRRDKEGSLHFDVPIHFAKGETSIQFRVRDKGEEEFAELTGWKILVK
jgi:hypothetical protein